MLSRNKTWILVARPHLRNGLVGCLVIFVLGFDSPRNFEITLKWRFCFKSKSNDIFLKKVLGTRVSLGLVKRKKKYLFHGLTIQLRPPGCAHNTRLIRPKYYIEFVISSKNTHLYWKSLKFSAFWNFYPFLHYLWRTFPVLFNRLYCKFGFHIIRECLCDYEISSFFYYPFDLLLERDTKLNSIQKSSQRDPFSYGIRHIQLGFNELCMTSRLNIEPQWNTGPQI